MTRNESLYVAAVVEGLDDLMDGEHLDLRRRRGGSPGLRAALVSMTAAHGSVTVAVQPGPLPDYMEESECIRRGHCDGKGLRADMTEAIRFISDVRISVGIPQRRKPFRNEEGCS